MSSRSENGVTARMTTSFIVGSNRWQTSWIECGARETSGRDDDTWEAELLAMPGAHRFLRPGSGKFSQTTTREQVKAAWDDLSRTIEEFKKRADASLAVDLHDELWPLVHRYEAASVARVN